jgi:hypothetical protein
MDKTIWSKGTPINLELVWLPKKPNRLGNNNLDLVWLSRKPNRLRRERTVKKGSPARAKSLKPKQFGLSCKQQHNTQQKNSVKTDKPHETVALAEGEVVEGSVRRLSSMWMLEREAVDGTEKLGCWREWWSGALQAGTSGERKI